MTISTWFYHCPWLRTQLLMIMRRLVIAVMSLVRTVAVHSKYRSLSHFQKDFDLGVAFNMKSGHCEKPWKTKAKPRFNNVQHISSIILTENGRYHNGFNGKTYVLTMICLDKTPCSDKTIQFPREQPCCSNLEDKCAWTSLWGARKPSCLKSFLSIAYTLFLGDFSPRFYSNLVFQ